MAHWAAFDDAYANFTQGERADLVAKNMPVEPQAPLPQQEQQQQGDARWGNWQREATEEGDFEPEEAASEPPQRRKVLPLPPPPPLRMRTEAEWHELLSRGDWASGRTAGDCERYPFLPPRMLRKNGELLWCPPPAAGTGTWRNRMWRAKAKR